MKERLYRPKLWESLQRVLGLRVRVSTPGPSLWTESCDLEEVLVEAAALALTEPLLPSMLASWLKVHAERVRTEKLSKLAREFHARHGANLFWLAYLARFSMSHGYGKWELVYRTLLNGKMWTQPDYERETAEARGRPSWLEDTSLWVSSAGVRVRESDVASPAELAAKNLQYRQRLRFGPDIRADVSYSMRRGIVTRSEVAKFIRCSPDTAGSILADLQIADSVET